MVAKRSSIKETILQVLQEKEHLANSKDFRVETEKDALSEEVLETITVRDDAWDSKIRELGNKITELVRELLEEAEKRGEVHYDDEAIEVIKKEVSEALRQGKRVVKIRVTGLDRPAVDIVYLVFSGDKLEKVVTHYNGSIDAPWKENEKGVKYHATAIVLLS